MEIFGCALKQKFKMAYGIMGMKSNTRGGRKF
jgi:hypothetical protein